MSESNPAELILCSDRGRAQIENALGYEFIRSPKGVTVSFNAFLAAVKDDLVRDRITGKGNLWQAFQTAPETAMSALSRCAQLKILPGSAYRMFHLIPRTNRGRLEVNGQIGYIGLCEVSRRHPRVHSVDAHLVYEDDRFDFNPGTGKCDHQVNPKGDRDPSKLVGGYARVIITEESTQHAVLDAPVIHFLTTKEIHKRRDCSDAYRYAERSGKKDSPWHEWPEMMARKTLLIAVLNHGSIPQDLGLGGALTSEMEEDRPPPTPSLPLPTRGSEMRAVLGIDKQPEQFQFAEEAVEFIHTADMAALEAAKGRWNHFQRTDAESIAIAFQNRVDELEARGP